MPLEKMERVHSDQTKGRADETETNAPRAARPGDRLIAVIDLNLLVLIALVGLPLLLYCIATSPRS